MLIDFLKKVVVLYKIAIVGTLIAAFVYIGFALGADTAPLSTNIANIFDVIGSVPVAIFNTFMLPLYETILGWPDFALEASKDSTATFILFFLPVLIVTVALIFTITVYFPAVLIVFPLLSILNPTMIYVWASYLNPLLIFTQVGLPAVDNIGNIAMMKSEDPVLKQMAINEDLAYRIETRQPRSIVDDLMVGK